MNRCLAFVLALLCASLSVASACSASSLEWVRFTLEQGSNSNEIKASFRDDSRGDHNWSTGFAPPQLIGLDVMSFRASGTFPLRFAIVREAGRLDCSGQGGSFRAAGSCRFTADASFGQLLQSRGIGAPTREQSFGLMAVNARRELIDGLVEARYPSPDINDLMSLSALGVSTDYIRGFANGGYRPRTIDALVQFKALAITPDYARGFARIGYGNISPADLVQLKALGVTPQFVSGFQRLGLGNLPVSRLVELKALNITPEFVEAVRREPNPPESVPELVDRKLFGRRQ